MFSENRAKISAIGDASAGRCAGVGWRQCAIAAVCVGLVLGAAPWLYQETALRAHNPDPFLYAQSAKELLAGKTLYDHTWQDKPPLAIGAYALPQLVKPRSYRAISFFHGLCLAIQAGMFAWVVRKIPGAAVCLALLVVLFPMTEWDFIWPSTEHFSNLLISANLLLGYAIHRQRRFTARQCLAWGVLTVLAFHVRQNAVCSAVFPALSLILCPAGWREKAKGVVLALIGGLVALGAVLLLVWRIGSLPGYYFTVFEYPGAYARAGEPFDVLNCLWELKRTLIPVLAAVAALLAFRPGFRWHVAIALAAGIGGCLLPMRPFMHYWANLLPYVAVLIVAAMEKTEFRRPAFAWGCAAAMAVLLVSWSTVRLEEIRNVRTCDWYRRVAATADALAPPGSTLWTCGPMPSEAIQFFSKLPAAHTFCVAFQLNKPWGQVLPRRPEVIFQEYLRQPPDVIVFDDRWARAVLTYDTPLNSVLLLRLLTQRHAYRLAAEVDGFRITLREGAGATSGQALIRF